MRHYLAHDTPTGQYSKGNKNRSKHEDDDGDDQRRGAAVCFGHDDAPVSVPITIIPGPEPIKLRMRSLGAGSNP